MAGKRQTEVTAIGIIDLAVVGQCRLLPKPIIRMPKSHATLLEKVLQLTKEENFPIGFLSWLTEHVDGIWERMIREFVTLIYRTVFAHYEHSDEKIIRGGPILPMATCSPSGL